MREAAGSAEGPRPRPGPRRRRSGLGRDVAVRGRLDRRRGPGRCAHPVRPGQVLHLSVPLPQRFRQYDINDSSYRTYALVRHARPSASALRVGVLFLGRHPPRGAEALPAELFLMPGDAPVAAGAPRADPAAAAGVRARTGWRRGGGGRAGAPGAAGRAVRTTRLPVREALLPVKEKDGDYCTRAEVSSISIGADGQPRVSLHFLDAAPERLLPARGRRELQQSETSRRPQPQWPQRDPPRVTTADLGRQTGRLAGADGDQELVVRVIGAGPGRAQGWPPRSRGPPAARIGSFAHRKESQAVAARSLPCA